MLLLLLLVVITDVLLLASISIRTESGNRELLLGLRRVKEMNKKETDRETT